MMKVNESYKPISIKSFKIEVNDLKLEVKQLKEKQIDSDKRLKFRSSGVSFIK